MSNSKSEKRIHQYLNKSLNENSVKISKCFIEEEQVICHALGYSWDILLKYLEHTCKQKSTDSQTSSFTLLVKAINSLLAAYELCIGGYIDESGIILRNSLETICVSYDISTNRKRYNRFVNDRNFKSAQSINSAKKFINLISPLYNMFSEMHVHISKTNSIPNFVSLNGDHVKLHLGGEVPEGEENSYGIKGMMTLCVTLSFIILQTSEFIFKEYATNFQMWQGQNNELMLNPDKIYIEWIKKILQEHKKYQKMFQH